MSLGIAIKSAEGIVLAADSRVTITAQAPPGLFNLPPGPGGQPPVVVLPATYDNATKLLHFPGRKVGVITFGTGTIGLLPKHQPRTASSFVTEFEELSTEEFARRLGSFFLERWKDGGMPTPVPKGGDMIFYVAGFTGDEPIGRLYELSVPSHPEPTEQQKGVLGGIWGGQREIVDRIVQGFDPNVLGFTLSELKQTLSEAEQKALYEKMRNKFGQPIPWPLLPLQDCVNVAVFLVKATISVQGWSFGLRGVGGAVDVATITRSAGFQPVVIKEIRIEREL
jgi:hypothetical protein